MAKLFGFSIEDTQKKSTTIVSPVPKNNEDGVDNFISSGFYGQYVDIEGAYRSEYDLIKRYREMALHPECDGAIEDVVNEAIVSDLYDSPVEIELSNLNVSPGLKKKIREEFKYLKELMEKHKFKQLRFVEWIKTNPQPINSRLNYLTNSREIAILGVKKGKPTFNGEYDNGIYRYPIQNGKDRFHPTQKSIRLFEDLIKKHSNEGDVVVDTFLGGWNDPLSRVKIREDGV